MLAATVLLLALVVLGLVLFCVRISRNVGLLDLEDYARRQGVVFIPISAQLADELSVAPSKPCRWKLDRHAHPLLAELIILPPT